MTERQMKLLLAEDNYVNQEVAVDILQRLGCVVDVAVNGVDVIKAVEQNDYDMILMDCQMPVMDGYAATMLLRKREKQCHLPQIPVIAITAHALIESREKCLASGMSDYLCKPISFSAIEAMLAKWGKTKIFKSDQEFQNNVPLLERTVEDNGKQKHSSSESADNYADVLDQQVISGLRERQKIRKNGFMRKVIELYLEQTPKLLSEMNASYQQGDNENVLFMAHTIKSSSIIIGASVLARTCVEIESMAKAGELSQKLVSEINQSYSCVEHALCELLANEA